MGRELHGSRAPARDSHRDRRSHSVAACARRTAGACLFAALAFVAAPEARAQTPTFGITDLTLSPATVNEGDGRVNITVTATLGSDAFREVTLYVDHLNARTENNADAADYSTDTSIDSAFNLGPGTCGAANWGGTPTKCVRTLSFDIVDDHDEELDEKLRVYFGTTTYNSHLGRRVLDVYRSADLTIAASDVAPNAAPTVTTTAITVDENTERTAALLMRTDAEADDLARERWRFEDGGVDNDKFSSIGIDGRLTFKTAPDFEHPVDDGQDNTYKIKVATQTGSNTSRYKWSAPADITVTIADVNEPPGLVTNIRRTGRTDDSLTIAWDAPTEMDRPAVGSYRVQWKYHRVESWTGAKGATVTGMPPATSHEITGLVAGSRYDVRIVAINAEGNGEPATRSNADQTTTGTPPAASVTVSESAVTVNENGGTATFTVKLDTKPRAYVTVDVSSTAGATVSLSELTFTESNYSAPQTVTVIGAHDADADDTTATVTLEIDSDDERFDVLTDPTVEVTVTDDDTELAQVQGLSLAATSGQIVASWSTVTNASGYRIEWGCTDPAMTTGNHDVTGQTTATYTIPNLPNGFLCSVTVRALGAGAASGTGTADGPRSDTQTATPMMAVDNPPMVTTTTLTVAENETVVPDKVQANDADDGDEVTGFALAGNGADNGKFTIDNQGTLRFSNAPDFEANGSAAGDNDYKITVTATSGSGTPLTSAPTPITVTVTNVNEPPGEPADPTITEETDNSFKVSWQPPATNTGPAINRYDVEYKEDSATQWQEAQNEPVSGTLEVTISGLMPATDYDVRVRAANPEGDGAWSSEGGVRASTLTPQLDTPGNLTLTAGDGEIGVSWSDVDNEVGYSIDWTCDATTGSDTVDANVTAYDIQPSPPLANGTQCTVTVTATAGDGYRDSTAASGTATPVADPNVPATGAPTIDHETPPLVGQTLTADTSDIDDADGLTGATYNYQWIRGTNTNIGTNQNTYTLAEADRGSTIKLRISFTDDRGFTETLTSAATPAVKQKLAVPQNFAVETNGDAQVSLTWTAVDHATGYTITRTMPTPAVTQTASGTAHTWTGLTNGDSYTFVIRATAGADFVASDDSSEVIGQPNFAGAASAALSSNRSPLTEANIGGSTLTVDLTNATFSNSLSKDGFSIVSAASGLSVNTVMRANNTQATVTVTASGFNIAVDTPIQVRIPAAAVDHIGSGGFDSSSVTVATVNTAPTFTGGTTRSFSRPENQTEVGMVSATDSDPEDSVTYALSGADADHFTLGETTGVLAFTEAPDFERGSGGGPGGTSNAYTVIVTATGSSTDHPGRTMTATQDVTVNVTNVGNERPGKPDAPTLDMATADSLRATWSAPANEGPEITGYDLRYQRADTTSPNSWTNGPQSVSDLTDEIDGLDTDENGVEYRVQVRARNADGPGDWSDSASAETAANAAPTFTGGATRTFTANENQTVAGTVEASDADSQDSIESYTIPLGAAGGADRDKFNINSNTGALTFKSAPNFEAPGSADGDNDYEVVVRATGGTGARALTVDQTVTVTVEEDGTLEVPGKPDPPGITTAGITPLTVPVTWTAPANPGPEITTYNLQYRVKTPQGAWMDQMGETGTGASITNLTPGETYQVRVQAVNRDGAGAWSGPSVDATTQTNAAPVFDSGTASFTADENQTTVGPVTAMDSDGDDEIENYAIPTGTDGGADGALFNIDQNTGALAFKTAPNFEAEVKSANGDNDYTVVVRATSGTGDRTLTRDQTVTVTVRDVDEPPGALDPLTFGTTTVNSIVVNWEPPTNTGPTMTYDLRYREKSSGDPWTDVTGLTVTTYTISSLTVNTLYEVEVRARNAEGESEYVVGDQRTSANEAPSFTSANAISVDENHTGTVVTVAAEDSDSGDSVTGYTLGGDDAGHFTLGATSGVLAFMDPPDYENGSGGGDGGTLNVYTITVTATSGTGARMLSAPQTITITVDDVAEAPDQPVPPTLAVVDYESLRATWVAPNNRGPAEMRYALQYRLSGDSDWTDGPSGVDGLTSIIDELDDGMAYVARVQAENEEGASEWSEASTTAVATHGNNPPGFASTVANYDVQENTTAVTTVTASDPDAGDVPADATITYALEGDDGGKFRIASNGALTFESGKNFEDPDDANTDGVYAVTVRATSGQVAAREMSATRSFTVTLTNAGDEAPGQPAAPTVDTPTVNSLDVSWSAPATNAGPAIIDYDVRWQKTAPDPNIPGDGDWIELPDTGDDAEDTDTSVTITGLVTDSAGVEYRVQVRAQNAEGTGDWSPSTTGRTAANGPPDFTDATIAFTVDENTDAATPVGTVTATDPDGGDTVTGYTLGGADASKFDISSTGVLTFDSTQVPTVDYEMPQDVGGDNVYNITVTATSGSGVRELMADQAVTVTVRNVDETPSGKPSIDDTTPQVGQELTAGPGDIDTPDTPSPVFSYQWNRIDGGTSEAITGATAATYTVQEADGGLTLTVTARWTDDFDGSTQELTSDPTGAVATVPAAPTGVTADSFTSSGFAIRWTAPATGGRTITAYEYRFGGTGAWQSTGNSNTSRNFTSLSLLHADRDTLFEVRAVNAVGEGPAVTIVLNRQRQVNTPTVSLSLDTNSIDESGPGNSATLTVTLDGTATTADTVFSVPQHDDYGSSPASRTIAAGSGARSVTFTITAANDNTYEPNRVVDVDVDIAYTGTPAIPDPAPARLTIEEDDLQPPARVTGVTVTPVAEGLRVTWNAADRADGYKVHWRSGGTYPQANERTRVGSSSTTDTIPNLDPDTTYTVRVTATRTGADDGPESDDSLAGASGRPKAQPPGQPGNLTPTPGGESLIVSWTAGSNADGYKVQWKLDSAATWAGASEQDGITALFWTIPGLTPGVDYDVRVAATRNNADDSGWTAPATAAPLLAALAQVTNVQVRSGVRELTVTWSPVPNAEGYKVQWKSGTQGFDAAQQLEVTGTRATIPALDPLVPYTVRVIATRAGGADGTPSEDATGTPARSDRPGLVVSAPTPSTVGEGAAATFTVELDFQPTADVVVALLSGDTGTVTLQPAELTFTPDNWAMKQTVTARAIEDDDAANETVRLTVRVVDSRSASAYRSVGDERLDLRVTDNDTASVTVAAPASFNVPEDGSATYTVVLDRPPSSSVRIRVASGDTTALSVTPGTLTFSTSNWDTPKQVTARGVRDADSDHESVTISHEVIDASSADEYDGVPIASVTATLADINTPGVRVSRTALSPAEGGTASYTLRLNTQPSEDVTVTVSSDNPDVTLDADNRADGDQAAVTFTSANWSSARTVTVRAAQDDDSAEDAATLTHTATSGDSDYGGIDIPTVEVTVDDDETPGITLSALSPSPVLENFSATYTVVLDAQPTSSVVLDITGDNDDVTVQPARLTFTTGNWDEAQTVTVSAADDSDSLDERATLTHVTDAAASANEYDPLAATLSVPVEDDDVPGLTLSGTTLSVGEGTTATYQVSLQVEPSADVTVAVAADNQDVNVDQPRLTFTADNWDRARTVTVSAAQDGDVADDLASVIHRIVDGESAAEYRRVADRALAVTVDDDDLEASRSIRIMPATVSEGDGAVDVWVAVDLGDRFSQYYVVWAEGSNSVAEARQRALHPDNWDFSGGHKTEGEGPSIRFTTGADGTFSHRLPLVMNDDEEVEANERVLIRYSMSTVPHGQLTFNETLHATLVIVDNDGPGAQASAAALSVPEEGSAEYSLQLNTRPAAAVTVAVRSDNVEVVPSPASLTFTPQNWNEPRTVTVTGLSDVDGVEDRAVLTHAATSSDSQYNGVAIGDVVATVTNGATTGGGGGGDGGSSGGGGGGSSGGGSGGGGSTNTPPPVGETLSVAAGESKEAKLSTLDLRRGSVASSDPGVASAEVMPDGTLRVTGHERGVAVVTVTPNGGSQEPMAVEVTVTGPARVLHLPPASDELGRQGFVRLINHSPTFGEVAVEAVDDTGRSTGTVTVPLPANGAAHFNTTDLEDGNPAKGIDEGVGRGLGAWRLVLTSDLAFTALGYIRTPDGFLTSMHDAAPADGDIRRIAFINPASNWRQVSRLRVANPGARGATVRVTGVDDAGRAPPASVEFDVLAGAAVQLTADELEARLGDGAGKWRLEAASEGPVAAMSLLESPTGHLTNLSTVPRRPDNGRHVVPFLPPASDLHGRQGFVRVANRSGRDGTATIRAFDDAGTDYGALTLTLGAGRTTNFNTHDLEVGNPDKGLAGSTGPAVAGGWRLELRSGLKLDVLAYVRHPDGFVTAMHDLAPAGREGPWVAFLNPASNWRQVSLLRLVNPGGRDASVTLTAIDDAGASGRSTVTLTVPAGTSRTISSVELEEGAEGLNGALGDGKGKWRLRIASDEPVLAMSLLESPTGHLTNLSTAPQRGAR